MSRVKLRHQLSRILCEQGAFPLGKAAHTGCPPQRPSRDLGAEHLSIAACTQDDESSAVEDNMELPKDSAATAWSLTGKPSGLCNLHNREQLSSFHLPARSGLGWESMFRAMAFVRCTSGLDLA